MADILLFSGEIDSEWIGGRLAQAGHRVTLCHSNSEIVKTLQRAPLMFDLVVIDLDSCAYGHQDPASFIQQLRKEVIAVLPADPEMLCLMPGGADWTVEFSMRMAAGAHCASKCRPEEWLCKTQVIAQALSRMRECGPLLRLTHLFSPEHSNRCFPDEEIAAMEFIHPISRQAFAVCKWSKPLLLGDFLARHRRYALSAQQIAFGISVGNVFYSSKVGEEGFTCRAAITNMNRLRNSLRKTFADARVPIRAEHVLRTERSEADAVSEWLDDRESLVGDKKSKGRAQYYRLHAEIEIIHP